MRRDEIAETPLLLKTCKRVVKRVCKRYDPSYSPTHKWDEDAYDELMCGWISKDLIDNQGKLKPFVGNLENNENFVALAKSFQWYLINSHERTETTNLYRRVKDFLPKRFHCFIIHENAAYQYWGKREWSEGKPYQGSEEQLAKNPKLQEFRPLYYVNAEKLSPILSDSSLPHFIVTMMDLTSALFSLPQIISVMSHRFNLSHPRIASIYEPISNDGKENAQLISDTLTSSIAIEIDTIICSEAESLYLLLSAYEKQAILFWLEEVTLQEISHQTGEPITTIHGRRKQLGKRLRTYFEMNVEEPYRVAVLKELYYRIGLDCKILKGKEK